MRSLLAVLSFALAVSAIPLLPTASACDPVDVTFQQDACGTTLAVSVAGDASGAGGCNDLGETCIAASGTGNAANAARDCGFARDLPVAVSCIAVSGTGTASNQGSSYCGVAWPGVGVGCIAASGTGHASNSGSCGLAFGVAIGCIAASGTGHASNEGWCGLGYAGLSVSCIAVSALGSAHNSSGACARSTPFLGVPGSAVACASISGGDGTIVGPTVSPLP